MQNYNNFNRKLTHHNPGSEEVGEYNKNNFKQTNFMNQESQDTPQKIGNHDSLNVDWPLPQGVSEPIKKEKQYLIKIASNDTDTGSPFDFKVKFAMQKIDSNTNSQGNTVAPYTYRKEAVVQSKFQEIASLEVVDVVVPRFIPNNSVGIIFDGFRLVLDMLPAFPTSYFISPDPGCDIKYNVLNYSGVPVSCIKLTNHKESIILIQKDVALNYTEFSGSFFSNTKIYDHLVINNQMIPISSVDNAKINLPTIGPTIFPNFTLPQEIKVIVSTPNLIFNGAVNNNITISSNKIIIPQYIAPQITYNILKNNTLRIFNSTNEYYFNVDSILIDISGVVTIKGNEYSRANFTTPVSLTTTSFYLYTNGVRDLLDERIFYLEIYPFTPVKSTSTNTQNDKMFGLLFPSSQSKQWLYLSGEPKETFLPSDYRKLDRINVKIYDAAGNNLNDVFDANPNLLKNVYKNNIFTSMNIKIDEVERTLGKQDAKKLNN
jgi:hypothetical protein